MNEVSNMHTWLQGRLGAAGFGQVNLEVCDGVPGNWTLYYLGTREIKRSPALHGAALVRYRCHYQLKFLCNGSGIIRSRIVQALLESAQETGQGPVFSPLSGGLLTVENVRRTKVNPDGTGEYCMDIYAEYDRYWEV